MQQQDGAGLFDREAQLALSGALVVPHGCKKLQQMNQPFTMVRDGAAQKLSRCF
jgi:hypothetical protein